MLTLKDLEPFCSKDKARTVICKPWLLGGYTWATDGRILVRIPAAVEGVTENIFAPNVIDLWQQKGWRHLDGATEFVPLPKLPPVEENECEACHGSGGWECNCHDCCTLHTCGNCDGAGNVQRIHGVDVGNRILGEQYLAKIAALPNPMLCLAGEPMDVVGFKFDGGEGRLMPMKGKQ